MFTYLGQTYVQNFMIVLLTVDEIPHKDMVKTILTYIKHTYVQNFIFVRLAVEDIFRKEIILCPASGLRLSLYPKH